MFQQKLVYYLSEHPSVVGFRWSHSQSFGNTWPFLFTSITTYVITTIFLHLFFLLLFRHRKPLPLGPIPALHALSMSLISATIFAGILLSSAAEIRDTRWFWRRSKLNTPFQWLLCFPLGTRSTGRVFFWSYMFYISRFAHSLRTIFAIIRRRRLPFFQIFNNCILILMSFLWLEYSQSFQVLAILLTTLINSMVYAYRFWSAIGLKSGGFGFVFNCRMVLLGGNFVCHFGVILLHFKKGGCNGIGAWVFNSVLNVAIMFLFLNFYVKMHWGRMGGGGLDVFGGGDSGGNGGLVEEKSAGVFLEEKKT